jgi:hypothetical protein
MSKNDEWEKLNSTRFKSLVGSLRYLACTRLNILYGVGLVSWFMETPTMIHFKALKWILRYIKDTIDFGLFYGYSDSDWAGDMDDRNSTIGFVFYMWDNFHMEFKEAIYCHIIYLWSWICSYYNMCLSFHVAKKIIEGVANTIREAYKDLCGQLISHCIS